jgi:glyoxylase-like metal-dependent hydrolase (beta-lactamase superfamily II)
MDGPVLRGATGDDVVAVLVTQHHGDHLLLETIAV